MPGWGEIAEEGNDHNHQHTADEYQLRQPPEKVINDPFSTLSGLVHHFTRKRDH